MARVGFDSVRSMNGRAPAAEGSAFIACRAAVRRLGVRFGGVRDENTETILAERPCARGPNHSTSRLALGGIGTTLLVEKMNQRTMNRHHFVLLCVAVALGLGSLVAAQEKVGVYIGDIKGPDGFLSERVRLLFMEEFAKVKMIEVVNSREKAQLVLDGIVGIDSPQQGAVLSVKLLDPGTSRIVFAGNKTEMGSTSGAARNAVLFMVKDMKKALKWK